MQNRIHRSSITTADPCVFSLTPPICSTGEINAFLDLILTVDESLMYSFDYGLKQQNAEWRAQKLAGTKIAWRSQVFMLFMFFSRNGLMLDHPMPVVTTVNGQYYCAFLHNKVRLAVCCKPKLLEHDIHMLQDSATLLRHRDV